MFSIKIGDSSYEIQKDLLIDKSKYFKALIEHEEEFHGPKNDHIFDSNLFKDEDIENFVLSLKDEPLKLTFDNVASCCIFADFLSDLDYLQKCSKFIIDHILYRNNLKIFKVAVTLISRLVIPDLTFAVLKIIAKNPQINKKAIEEIGIQKFSDVLPICQMIMKDKKNIFMGKSYFEKAREFFMDIFKIEENELENYFDKEIKYCHENQLNFIVPWALENYHTSFVNCESLSNTTSISRTFATHANFDPSEWKIHKVTIYFIKLYGEKYRGKGNRPVAGFDITYKNIWDYTTKLSPFLLNEQGIKYAKTSFELKNGETIRKMEIIGEHRIDVITFYTSHGRELGPYGRSMLPESRLKTRMIAPKQYKKPSSNETSKGSAFIMSEKITKTPLIPKEASIQILSRGPDGPVPHSISLPYLETTYPCEGFHGLALHGFTYTILRKKYLYFWGLITPVFSGIPGELIRNNPGINWETNSLII